MIIRYKVPDMVLGDWELVREIGRGGFATVYEARRVENDHVFHSAIKIIPVPTEQRELDDLISKYQDENVVREYLWGRVQERTKEIERMFALKGRSDIVCYEDHKVVPCPEGIGWDIIIRMELLTELGTYLKEHEFTRSDVIRLGINICRALEACNRNGIVHQDIKVENLFVSPHGDFKLGDLGIACDVSQLGTLTSMKVINEYDPPEKLMMNSAATHQGDIYSLGIVLYKLANKLRAPFENKPGDSASAFDRRMRNEKFPDPAHGDDALNRVIMKACAFRCGDRYQSAEEMRKDLEALFRDEFHCVYFSPVTGGRKQENRDRKKQVQPQDSGEKPEPARSSKKKILPVLAAVLALLIIVFGIILTSDGDDVTVSLPEAVVLGKNYEVSMPYTLLPDDSRAGDLVFSCADSSVATVNQGILLGRGSGETTITVTCGDSTAECEVFVLDQQMYGQLYELVDFVWCYQADGIGTLISVDGQYYWHDAKNTAGSEMSGLLQQAAVQELAANSVKENVNWLDCYQDPAQNSYCGSVLLAQDARNDTVVIVHSLNDTYVLGLDQIVPPDEPYTQLRMEESEIHMVIGEQRNVTAFQVYEDGSVTVAAALTWMSADQGIAAVENGMISAVGAGSTIITATDGVYSCVCTVTVEEKLPDPTEAPTEQQPQNNGSGTGSNQSGASGQTTKPTTPTTPKPTTPTTPKPTTPTTPTTPKPTNPPATTPPATEAPTDPPETEPPVTEPPETKPPETKPVGKAPSSYSISVSSSSVFVYQPFVVTVRPDVSDYTKIVIHAIDPTGGRWDFTISSGNTYDLEVYDPNLTGTWTLYADVYNQYGVFYGASGGARTALTVYELPI